MSTDTNLAAAPASGLATGVWHLDPTRSSVEFHVPHFYGLGMIWSPLGVMRAPSKLIVRGRLVRTES